MRRLATTVAICLAVAVTGCGGGEIAAPTPAPTPEDAGEAFTTSAPAPSATPTSAPSATSPASPDAPTSPASSPSDVSPSSPAASPSASAAAADLNRVAITLTPVATLDAPTAFAIRPGDDTLWIAQRGGTVVGVRGGEVDGAPLIDIQSDTTTGGERGLLGIAFSPDGNRFYASYTNREGDSRLDEWTMSGDRVDEGSRRTLLRQDQPYSNHNGGNIAFGPDGMLYLGLGDGGSAGDPLGNGQSLGTLLGKLLRIDPTPGEDGAPYTIPPGNPFVDRAGALPEIWAYGLRNPWRFSFDAETGDLWIGDVGEKEFEEVNWTPLDRSRGANYGWDALEGNEPFEGQAPPTTWPPVAVYTHDDGACSVTGGYVYRGSAIPDLVGAYVYGDYCQGRLVALVQQDGVVLGARDLGVAVDALVSFGQGPDGELYVLSLDGQVSRIDPA